MHADIALSGGRRNWYTINLPTVDNLGLTSCRDPISKPGSMQRSCYKGADPCFEGLLGQPLLGSCLAPGQLHLLTKSSLAPLTIQGQC